MVAVGGRLRQREPGFLARLPGGKLLQLCLVQLRTRRLALACDDDNLVETAGCRQPDADVIEAGEQPFLAGLTKTRLGDDVDEQTVAAQGGEEVLQELVFQPYPLAAGFLVTKIPAIGRIEKKAIDRLWGDVCLQVVGVLLIV